MTAFGSDKAPAVRAQASEPSSSSLPASEKELRELLEKATPKPWEIADERPDDGLLYLERPGCDPVIFNEENDLILVIKVRNSLPALLSSLAAMREALEEWEECARYDPMMDGTSRFKGWDKSALDRCRHKMEERRAALREKP